MHRVSALPFLGQFQQRHVVETEVDEILQQLLSQVVLDGLREEKGSKGEARAHTKLRFLLFCQEERTTGKRQGFFGLGLSTKRGWYAVRGPSDSRSGSVFLVCHLALLPHTSTNH